MKRLFRVAGALALSLAASMACIEAQAASGWTLNINNSGANSVPAGGQLSYDVRITNDQHVTSVPGKISFTIPASTIYIGIEGLQGCTPDPTGDLLTEPHDVTCDVPELEAGESIDSQVIVSPRAAGVISLKGEVFNPDGDLPPPTSFDRPTTITQGADLEFMLTTTEPEVRAGSIAHFNATVKNHGPHTVTDAQIVIALPSGLSSTPTLPAGCSVDGGNIICLIPGPLEEDETISFDFSSQVTAGNISTITLDGLVESGTPPDANSSNNSSQVNFDVSPGIDLTLSKKRTPGGLIFLEDEVTFTLTPAVAGFVPEEATITDIVPVNYEIESVSVPAGSGWSCEVNGQAVECVFENSDSADYRAPIEIKTIAIAETGEAGIANVAEISSLTENEDALTNNTATDGYAHIQKPYIDLKAHKSGPPRGLVTVGNEYDYELFASNLGNMDYSGPVVITDHLPTGLTVTAMTIPAGWSCTPSTTPIEGETNIVCETNKYMSSPIAANGGVTDTITFTAEVTEPGTITNGMTVSFPGYVDVDVDLSNNTTWIEDKSADANNWADIRVEKKVSSPVVTAGDEITFTIQVINDGPVTATTVILDDKFENIVGGLDGQQPDEITPVINYGNASGISCEAPSGGNYSRNLQCTISELPKCVADSTCPTFEITVRQGSQGDKTNTATAFSLDTPDNYTLNNSSSVPYKVLPLTDVTVTKIAPASANGTPAGQEITYTLSAIVTGNGLSHAEEVKITDTLPHDLIFVSATPNGPGVCTTIPVSGSLIDADNDELVCELGTINNGSQTTVSVVVIPTTKLAETTIKNHVKIETKTDETNEDNNETSLDVNILSPVLDLRIDKTDAGFDPVLILEDTVYTITVNNSGPSDAFNVTITDDLPTDKFRNPRVFNETAGLECRIEGASETAAGGQIICDLSRLVAGGEASFKLHMESFERGRATNNASVTSDEIRKNYESPVENNTIQEDTTVRVKSDLFVTKVASVTSVDLREEFEWHITVESREDTGLDVSEEVVLNDTLPEGMVLTDVPSIDPPTAGTCTGEEGDRIIRCELGDIFPGPDNAVVVTLKTKIIEMKAEKASNTAVVKTESFEDDKENNESTGTVDAVLGSTVSGNVFMDFKGDGKTPLVDTGIAGVTITITGTAEHDNQTITREMDTDADGNYSFVDLPPGTYSVSYSTVPNPGLYEPDEGDAYPGKNPKVDDPTKSGIKTIVGIITLGTKDGDDQFAHINNDFSLIPIPAITLDKTVGAPTFLDDGSYTLEYTLVVTNDSLEPLENITVSDVLTGTGKNFGTYINDPAPQEGQYTILEHSTGFGELKSEFNGDSQVTIVSGGILAVGENRTVTVIVKVKPNIPWVGASTIHVNEATTEGTGKHSGKSVNDDASVSATVEPTPEITLEKSETHSWAEGEGDVLGRIDYTFTITNTGNVPLTDISLSDLLDNIEGLDANTRIAQLDPSESDDTTFTAHYILTQADLDRGYVTNNATTVGRWSTDPSGTVSDSDSVTVDSLADPKLVILKEVDTDGTEANNPSSVGENIRYKFTVTNTGNTNLYDVEISDILGAAVVPSPGYSFSIPDMPRNGDPVIVYADYKVTLADINAGTVHNVASAIGKHGEDKPVESNESPEDVTLYQNAKLKLVKAAPEIVPINPKAGDPLVWKVTATNEGNVTLYNVIVTDRIAGAEISPVSVAEIEPGIVNSATFTVTTYITQDQINAGEVENTADADFTSPKGEEPSVPSNPVVVPLNQTPDIELIKTADLQALPDDRAVQEGDEVLYTLTIRNIGNVPLDTITLEDVLEDFVFDEADYDALTGLILQPQNSTNTAVGTEIIVKGSYKLKLTDIENGYLENTAHTTGTPTHGTNREPIPASDTTNTPLERAPSIELIKSITTVLAEGEYHEAEDEITFGFKITNTGNVTINDIRIVDEIDGVTVFNISNWTGPLKPGESNETAFTATYKLKQEDIQAGSFINTAEVFGTSINGTEDDVNDESSVTLDIEQTSGLSIVKSADQERIEDAEVGDEITYTFLVTNIGNVTLTNVVVTDPLIDDANWIDNPVIETLLPGKSEELSATYPVTQADIQAGKVDNTATVNGKDGDTPLEPVPSEEVTVELEQSPDIKLVKAKDDSTTTLPADAPAEVGDIIGYTFTVTNTGNMILTNVTLSDILEQFDGFEFTEYQTDVLNPGEEWTTTATYIITEDDIDAGEVINEATVVGTYDEDGQKTVDDESDVTVEVIAPEPELTLVKTGAWLDENQNGYPEAGELIEYTFTVTNTGNAIVKNVTPEDGGPKFDGQDATNTLSAFTPGPVTLAPGEEQVFTATYPLSQEDIDATAGLENAITNIAVAAGTYRRDDIRYESNPDDAVVTLPATEPSNVIITKQALLYQVKRGERVPYIIKVENTSSSNAGPVNVIDTMPSGFRFIEDSATFRIVKEGILPPSDWTPIAPVVNGRRVTFEDLQLEAISTIEIRLDLMVLSSAGPGKHVNTASVTDRHGTPVAKDAHATVEIVAEPIFDCGEIIGTVFDDINSNGYQDEGEPGLPGVRVATVKGLLITTDKYGRFHVPCAALPDQRIGSNFIMKLDPRTLPTGYRLTTENPRVVRLTAGKMTKLNFGASISRVIRLDLKGSAFKPNSTELQQQWADNLGKLIVMLREEPSVLRINFTDQSADADLAKKQVKALRDRIADLWKKNGASYDLEIETRIKAGQ